MVCLRSILRIGITGDGERFLGIQFFGLAMADILDALFPSHEVGKT